MAKSNLTWRNTCQKCRKRKESTRPRQVYTGAYTGPCGDSFCFASCDMESCRPIDVTVCDECETELKGAKHVRRD